MNVFRRSLFYIRRKKGQTVVLFLLFSIVSAFLISCFSILDATDAVAKDLRTSVGGAFYLRPSPKLDFKDGEAAAAEGPPPAISEEVIKEIMSGGNIKYCNALNYGYARSEALNFIPGAGHNDGSNMGKVAAMHYTSLADQFLEGKLELTEGRHLTKNDQNKILISEQLATANKLKVGDTIRFTHAGLERENGEYKDSISEKSAFSQAEIAGIYKEVVPQAGDADSPTPGRGENLIFSDHSLLLELEEANAGQYAGEVNFYVADPLLLRDITGKVEQMDAIDWGQYSLRENDFQYGMIADSLGSIQNLTRILIACISIVSIVILILILTMRIRGRIHETGILLAIGKTKREIVGQFISEVFAVFLLAFLCATLVAYATAGGLEQLLLGGLPQTNVDLGAIETGLASNMGTKTYFQIGGVTTLLLFFCQAAAMATAVVVSCGGVFSLKPKEILTKMS